MVYDDDIELHRRFFASMGSVEMNRVVSFFKLHDASGMPWETLAIMTKEKGMLPDWEDFFMGACKAKWKRNYIQDVVREIAGVFRWHNDPIFWERVDVMWKLAALRTGWGDDSWKSGMKKRTHIKVQS